MKSGKIRITSLLVVTAFILTVTLISGCASESASRSTSGGGLSGTVTDATSGDPLSGAFVSIKASDQYRVAVTNSSGQYSFSDIGTSSVVISVAKDVYSEYSATVDVSTGSVTHNVKLSLKSTALRLSGKVVNNATGKGVKGALVTVGTNRVRTDESGGFEIALSKGPQTVTVFKEGYAARSESIKVTKENLAGNQIEIVPDK